MIHYSSPYHNPNFISVATEVDNHPSMTTRVSQQTTEPDYPISFPEALYSDELKI